MAKNSFIGQKFGMLEVVKEESRGKFVYCLCKCDCGNSKWIRRDHLKHDIRNCGCKSTSFREKAKREDLTGKKFGKLTVIEKTDKKDCYGTAIYKCRCDCGNITEVNARMLKIGNTRSCGCLRKKKEEKKESKSRIKNLTGQKFGKLTAIRATDKRLYNSVVWECKCDCGNIVEASSNFLARGLIKSCGCLKDNKDNKKCLNLNRKKGITGILFNEEISKWITTIVVNGESIFVGNFENKEEAIAALEEALKNVKRRV